MSFIHYDSSVAHREQKLPYSILAEMISSVPKSRMSQSLECPKVSSVQKSCYGIIHDYTMGQSIAQGTYILLFLAKNDLAALALSLVCINRKVGTMSKEVDCPQRF